MGAKGKARAEGIQDGTMVAVEAVVVLVPLVWRPLVAQMESAAQFMELRH
jgi:hypothetical protein